jgi:signal transduction histidine kinase
MESLIDDLPTLAREGEEATDLEDAELADICRECFETVETTDAETVVEATGTVRADPGRLKQLLENLFRNAVEHGSTSPPSHAREDAVEHGPDDVTITVGDRPDGFYVENDGPGIPADERERVFESGVTSSESDTGFGLAIVEEIAAAHGWDVVATEGSDGGARFEITGVDRRK